MSEFKSVDAWAVVGGDDEIPMGQTGSLSIYRTPLDAECHWANALRAGSRCIPVTISPRAEWVKVSERLPEINQDVLLIGPYWDRTSIGQRCLFPKNKMRNADSWFWEMSLNGHLMTSDGAATPMEYERDEVTHWMPLPQAPEGE